MTHSHAIEVKKLFKVYKGNIIAINNIDLNIPHGSIFGLLGPNGAGKSTFINILAGLASKSSGSVKICDIDIDSNPKTARGAIGVVPQEVNIDPYFTPIEILDNQAGYYGISSKDIQNKTIPSPLRPKFRNSDQTNIYFLSKRKFDGKKREQLNKRIRLFISILALGIGGYYLSN